MRHLYECPMRWADLDMLGHVNNVVYADYLQEARVDMLRVHARGAATGALAEGLVVVNNQLTYLTPLEFDAPTVSIEVWVTEIRPATMTLAYEIFREADGARRVFLRASTVVTPYVFSEERPRRFTAEERNALEAYLEPSESTKASFGQPRHTEIGHFPVQVRFSDVDVYGHVNNVKYFEYFQEARIKTFAQVMKKAGDGAKRPAMVVAEQDIEYKRPILFRNEPYDSWTWVSRVGNTSLILEGEIRDGDELLARGRFVMVFFDTATGRATTPPDDVRRALLQLAD